MRSDNSFFHHSHRWSGNFCTSPLFPLSFLGEGLFRTRWSGIMVHQCHQEYLWFGQAVIHVSHIIGAPGGIIILKLSFGRNLSYICVSPMDGTAEERIDMKRYDMIVIGGGPAGSMAALTAARQGLDTLLVERDMVIGSPVRCAEGVDHKGLSRFFSPDPRWISTTINRYYLVAPDGNKVEINTNGDCGYILERTIFDRMIAEQAAAHGADVRAGVEATGLSGDDGSGRTVTLRSNGTEWTARASVVIAADGVESRVARWAGIDSVCPAKDMETCAQVLLGNIDIDPNAFYLYFTKEFAPGGYAWVFPKGQGIANVGLGVSGDNGRDRKPVDYLNAFAEKYFPAGRTICRTVGGVQCSGGIKTIVADGLMVCGDSAHMANPMTGGGIINAMIAGEAAGLTAADALKKGRADARALKGYAKVCEDAFSKMNRTFYKVKEGIRNIPDERLNAIAREVLKNPVEKRTPIRVLTVALMKQPSLLALLPKLVI